MTQLRRRQKEEIIRQTLARISPAVAGSAPGPVVGVASYNGRTGNITSLAADEPVFIASGASHAPGAVPDPGAVAGATKFLREDATWQTVVAASDFSQSLMLMGG